MKSPILVTAVSMRRCNRKDLYCVVNPLYCIFCVKVVGIVQENLPMYVSLIDIPFKGTVARDF
jgi:hypothetical protein